MKVLKRNGARITETEDIVSISGVEIILGSKNFTGGLQYNGETVATLSDTAIINIDGGSPDSVYTTTQTYDCGGI